jgi:CubicO group peptidase (beta-lactamase class C family)
MRKSINDLKMKRFAFLILAGILWSPHPAGLVLGQPGPEEIDRMVKDAMGKFNVAGVAVGIVKDGVIVHARGYGVRSEETGEPVDEHTSFAIASNSKAFTTTALALLVEEGKLSWDDRVVDYLPRFRMYNEYVTQNFSIRDLLTHRSGLGLGAGDLQIWPPGSDFTMNDILVSFQYFEPVSAFRTRYEYDNILYLVAGEVIRRVSGMNWETFVKKRILEPLEMDHSCTLPPGLTALENLASPHLATGDRLQVIAPYQLDTGRINGAAAGVLSNAEDLCRWMLVHLNGGKYGNNLERSLFSEASQREMWKIHTVIDVRPDERYTPHFAGYGLGWRLGDMDGKMVVSHTGDLSGMLSKIIMIPDLDLGVVVLTNSYYGGAGLFRAVSQNIVDIYLGLEPYDWTAHYLDNSREASRDAQTVVDRVWETVNSGDHKQVRFGDYQGTYEDPWFGTVKIFLKEERLWFSSLRSPALSGPMYHYRANTFAIRWENRELDADAFALFSLDEEGRAQGFTMKGIAPDIDFSYDFQDLSFRRVAEF